MFRHLLKLVWNRKRANLLIILEMLISFLVVFAVSLLALYLSDNYRQPLGFDYRNVWAVIVDRPERPDDKQAAFTLQQVIQSVRELEEVEAVAGMSHGPYSGTTMGAQLKLNGQMVEYEGASASDSLPQVLGVQLTRGRWFSEEDHALNQRSVIINERLARRTCGDEDPIGKLIEWEGNDLSEHSTGRVIGVITDCRLDGEYSDPAAFTFSRQKPDDAPRTLLVRVRPGTSALFEEKLLRRLQAVLKDASFQINRLEDMRATMHKISQVPLIIFGLVTAFLMLMVAFGLTGVLWQNVTQRTREIGLRRAVGAPARAINWQILAELLLMTSLGVALGVLIVVQFPPLNVLGFIRTEVFVASIAAALAVIYGLTICCGLYPSWLATRVQPAEALHYE